MLLWVNLHFGAPCPGPLPKSEAPLQAEAGGQWPGCSSREMEWHDGQAVTGGGGQAGLGTPPTAWGGDQPGRHEAGQGGVGQSAAVSTGCLCVCVGGVPP